MLKLKNIIFYKPTYHFEHMHTLVSADYLVKQLVAVFYSLAQCTVFFMCGRPVHGQTIVKKQQNP